MEFFRLLESHNKTLTLNALPEKSGSFEPVLSSKAIKFHHDVLAKGYVDRYNHQEGDPKFNEAGAFLHNLYFDQFCQPDSTAMPSQLTKFLKQHFQSVDKFKKQFEETALKTQGSGWCYLSKKGTIELIANHQIKRDIALIIDMWEHAFLLDYQADKPAYLANHWKIIDWQVVQDRLVTI